LLIPIGDPFARSNDATGELVPEPEEVE